MTRAAALMQKTFFQVVILMLWNIESRTSYFEYLSKRKYKILLKSIQYCWRGSLDLESVFFLFRLRILAVNIASQGLSSENENARGDDWEEGILREHLVLIFNRFWPFRSYAIGFPCRKITCSRKISNNMDLLLFLSRHHGHSYPAHAQN